MLLVAVIDESAKTRIIPLVVDIALSTFDRWTDKTVLERASKIAGTVAKLDLTAARDAVNNLFELSFKWLSSPGGTGNKFHASVLVLSQLAFATPNIFAGHVAQFMKV